MSYTNLYTLLTVDLSRTNAVAFIIKYGFIKEEKLLPLQAENLCLDLKVCGSPIDGPSTEIDEWQLRKWELLFRRFFCGPYVLRPIVEIPERAFWFLSQSDVNAFNSNNPRE
ncbi:hypothetical protein RF11_01719 [Thelohanellus kitauei]|uniref:Uncharacterized protein n=1 Tax=Thelohanellus kitauei TaxID=669202 RepID=A0A0C2N168_THEKT|nr:hypothetical protein RF11_01719 [Thelohanellus kitauei]